MSDIIHGIVSVFHDIMQQCCCNGFISKSDVIDDNLGDSYRMKYIWLPGTTADIFVRFVCEIKCFLHDSKLLFTGTSLSCRFLKIGIVPADDFVVLLGEF